MQNTGQSHHHPNAPLPVTLSDMTFADNQALAGPGGSGPLPTDGFGSGGLATGGAMQTNGSFYLSLFSTRWLDNQAIGQQGKLAYGGALGMVFGYKTDRQMISQSMFRGNLAQGGDDPVEMYMRTTYGGAIENSDPNTTIDGTTLIDNTAQGSESTGIGVPGNAAGGAITNTGPKSSLSLTDDSFTGNRALGGVVVSGPESTDPDSGLASGGGLDLDEGTLTASGDHFSNNLAQSQADGSVHAASGGALYVRTDAGGTNTSAQLARLSFENNQASALDGNSAFGGALANFSSGFVDVASSYSGNQALVQGPGIAYGGGLYLASDSSLSQSSITGNEAMASGAGQGFGGGIAFGDDPTVSLQNVVVRLNHASTGGDDLYGDHQSP